MIRAYKTGAIFLVTIAACALFLIPNTTRIALGLYGERWYQIEQGARAIGYLSSGTRVDWLGRWHFESDLRIALARDNDMRTEEHLQFSSVPPHALIEARQTTHRNGRLVDATRLIWENDGYRWYSRGADGTEQRGQRFEGGFSLDDHLALERWLKAQSRAPGARTTVETLDLGERARRTRPISVITNEGGHVTVDSDAGRLIELDARLRPVSMKLAGIYDLRAVEREAALAPITALHLPAQRVMLDRPLTNPSALRALTLAITGSVSASALWPELVDGAPDRITLRAATRSDYRTTRAAASMTALATRDHPADHPDILQLAQQAVAEATSPAAQVAALTHFVHEFVTYDEAQAASSVLELLRTRRGDCTEFADLLTTLARSLGLPARTVFGLAYQADPEPAFRFHAWNEIETDGGWFIVDPTWNQLTTDATHLPLPMDHALGMALLSGEKTLRFEIIEERY
ncbi:MAG: transglutaminase-like domain-containing protein [Pseudomonadales bacterium]